MAIVLSELIGDERRIEEAVAIRLSISQRIMITNGLYFVVNNEYHLSEDGSCVCDSKGVLSDNQACAALIEGIKVALAAQMNLRRLLHLCKICTASLPLMDCALSGTIAA